MNQLTRPGWNRRLAAVAAIISGVIIACSAGDIAPAARPAPAPAAALPGPTAAPRVDVPKFVPLPLAGATARSTPAPTSTPLPAPTPDAVTPGKDTVILVTSGAPDQLGAWSPGCGGNVSGLVCEDLASDPLTWIDSATFELAPLSGVESWSQEAPDRWRFKLRDGVKFHNGELWNAAAAKLAIDIQGDENTGGYGAGSFGFHGAINGRVVDALTVDVVCAVECPILPRTTTFLKFQAPEWWASASEEERSGATVGFGPYRIVDWREDAEVELEAHEDYRPNNAFDSQAPAIRRVFQWWRDEEPARAALAQTGEADLAFELGLENIDRVTTALAGTSNEVYTLVADNIWHPELRKKQVREALALSIDCPDLMDTLFNGLPECFGNISQTGTVGITPENSAPYPYDPARARELLAEAGYDQANEIRVYTRQGRVYRDVELWEAVVNMWREVGVNATLQVLDSSRASEVRRSGCGQFPADDALRCAEFDPPAPTFASSHYYETVTANETLDLQRQLLLRSSCFNVNSRVCNSVPGLQDAIEEAISTPLGPDRARRLEDLGRIIRDEYWFLPIFQVVTVYGLAEDLDWTPRHDSRVRVNTMRFSR